MNTVVFGLEMTNAQSLELLTNTDMQGFRYGQSTSALPPNLKEGDTVEGIVKAFVVAAPFEGQEKGKLYCIMQDFKTDLRLRFGITQAQHVELIEDTQVTCKVASFTPTTGANRTKRLYLQLVAIGVNNVNKAGGAIEAELTRAQKAARTRAENKAKAG